MSGAQQTQTQTPPAQPVASPPPQGGTVAVMTERPRPSHSKPLTQLTIGEMLSDPRVKKMLADTATKHLSPDRMLRVISNAIRRVPKLALCTPMSLLGSTITCQTLGVEPNTPLGLAYLIPYEKRGKNPDTGRWETIAIEANLIIGYQGLIDLSRRTGNLVSIHADVVYNEDIFSFEYGSNMHLRHIPQGVRQGRTALFAYAHAKLSDGEAFEVLPYAEVLRIRDNTEGYKAAMRSKERNDRNWAETPWIRYEHEMACKTLVRRLAKWLPKSIEFANAVAIDEAGDRGGIDFSAIAADPSLAFDPDMAINYGNGGGSTIIEETDASAGGGQQQQTQTRQTPADAAAAARAATQQPQVETVDPTTGEIKTGPAGEGAGQQQQSQEPGDADAITRQTNGIIEQLPDLKTADEIAKFEALVKSDLDALPQQERARYATAKAERLQAIAATPPKKGGHKS